MSITNNVQDNNYPKPGKEDQQFKNQDEFDTQRPNRSKSDPDARQPQEDRSIQTGNEESLPDSSSL